MKEKKVRKTKFKLPMSFLPEFDKVRKIYLNILELQI